MNNIDILEEFINKYNTDEDLFCFVNYNTIQAISNLISENKELKEENKRLNVKIIDLYKYSIPKSKIKAKITQLDYNDISRYEKICKQEVLQEVLGKE